MASTGFGATGGGDGGITGAGATGGAVGDGGEAVGTGEAESGLMTEVAGAVAPC